MCVLKVHLPLIGLTAQVKSTFGGPVIAGKEEFGNYPGRGNYGREKT